MIAARKTIGLLSIAIVAFLLGQISVSFTGDLWNWAVVAGYLIALIAISFDLLRAIWNPAKYLYSPTASR
jgi:hypothetical protein